MLGTVLVVILVVALRGALPRWLHSTGWWLLSSSGSGLMLLIVIVLLLLGQILSHVHFPPCQHAGRCVCMLEIAARVLSSRLQPSRLRSRRVPFKKATGRLEPQ